MRQVERINWELDQLWTEGCQASVDMLHCCELFLHLGVDIVTRRFVSTGIVNELHRVHLSSRIKTKVSADSVGLRTLPFLSTSPCGQLFLF